MKKNSYSIIYVLFAIVAFIVIVALSYKTSITSENKSDNREKDKQDSSTIKQKELESIAWGDAKFGMPIKEVKKTNAFKNGVAYGDYIDYIEIVGEQIANSKRVSSFCASFKMNELYRVDIESEHLDATYIAELESDAIRFGIKFSNKYGTPSQFTANPISVLDFSSGDEFTYDQWDIGSKHIVILFGENHDSEFYYRIVIYNDKYPTKVDGKEIKRQNKIREIQKEKEKYQF
jgi:hypothetical protein